MIDNIDDLLQLYSRNKPGVYTIKPRVFFALVEKKSKQVISMNLQIPSSGIGSITMLEAAVMCSLLNLLNPDKVFEFGTFLGYSTALLANNTSKDCEIYTLDLGESDCFVDEKALNYSEKEVHEDDKKNDDYLRIQQFTKGIYYLSNLDSVTSSKIHKLKCNSLYFDPKTLSLENQMDLIFIDGGHESHIIEKDTENAKIMLAEKGIVVWHDYNSSIHRDVTDFVNSYSENEIILHVHHTLIAIQIDPSLFKQ